jgi:glutathione S-transferase
MVDDAIENATTHLTGTSKDKKLALKIANMELGKNSFLAGATLSLADIALWAAIHSTDAEGLPSNVKARRACLPACLLLLPPLACTRHGLFPAL